MHSTQAHWSNRAYLYYGTLREIHRTKKQPREALIAIDKALVLVNNIAEHSYLLDKKNQIDVELKDQM